jgi:hypothetical protein
MNKFDHKDYVANPAKYRLFKTATLRNTIVNESGYVDAGTIVGLEFFNDVYSAFYKRTEPVYKLHTGDMCFAANLADFTL